MYGMSATTMSSMEEAPANSGPAFLENTSLHPADIAVIVGYFVVVMAFGLWVSVDSGPPGLDERYFTSSHLWGVAVVVTVVVKVDTPESFSTHLRRYTLTQFVQLQYRGPI